MPSSESTVIGEIPGQGEKVEGQAEGHVVTGVTNVYQLPLDRLSKADPSNVMEVASSQLDVLLVYHQEV